MLSNAVRQQVGDQNPVVVAAQALGFSSDLDFLHHAATTKGVNDDVRESLIGAYQESCERSKTNIPYFVVAAIEGAFPNTLPEKGQQAREARREKRGAAELASKKKRSPRQCKPAHR